MVFDAEKRGQIAEMTEVSGLGRKKAEALYAAGFRKPSQQDDVSHDQLAELDAEYRNEIKMLQDEVERLRANAGQHKLEMDAACGELAEAQALLSEAAKHANGYDLSEVDAKAMEEWLARCKLHLSASPELSAPTVLRSGCNDWVDGAHKVSVDPEVAITDGNLHALWQGTRADFELIRSAILANEPVDIDERAYFCVWARENGIDASLILMHPTSPMKFARFADPKAQEAWTAWQARAALGRKP